ncbi:hypothetical protein RIR_jg30649.t1 [Rhizophagus irregularis DAOM 181602=DAOM 197198]|nr:hypothetical protein RIR_jg30649.t1 [Rhizophagus irregularis DAOM 181602=DAOM 197198]
MNAKFYVEILRTHIPEIFQMLGDRWCFQQDNDTSRLAKAFLKENVSNEESSILKGIIFVNGYTRDTNYE